MRVTQMMLSQSSLRHINQGYDRLGKIQDQLASGKKITRASQDPVVAMKGMRYRSQVTEVEQFKRNLAEAYNWMDTTDSALDQGTQALARIRELATQAANDSYTPEERANMAKEVAQLREHLESIANSKNSNKYIFNGMNTTTAPVENGVVTTNAQPVEIELMKGVSVQVNVNPQNVFSNELFTDIQALEAALQNEAMTGNELTGFIDTMFGHINNFVAERAELGARVNRVQMMESRLMEQEVIAKRIMSNNEDAEMEQVIIDLMTQESVHRAALSAGARIIQPTLMDFLR
ncbi:flagellar hook-associated protein FlgL [Alkalihalobacillus sp. MEB130]|uniref:flagellar hook-associated protein FlgL n=1 Tax=Alkalihalobacillus sp. MEB130 TaxID=2976704 RepID=UPI0028DE831C|nr:flagellar hook-associated protein FlgL [Alkalihalobacillus sp. MEB130]MDT8858788.1 flagellar hook-associated protein FlgL [Alkalihalobacillus sp. MEB130]